MNSADQEYFGKQPSTGCERLLQDCMSGDQTQFQREDTVEASSPAVNWILNAQEALLPPNSPGHASGGREPRQADELLTHGDRRWRNFRK
jgi:glucose-6-phosphate 1-dehydrogenase